MQQVASERLQDAWRKALTEARATSAPSVQRRPRSAVAQGGVKRAQPLLMAAGSQSPRYRRYSSLLDTVVVTRRWRRVTSFAFPSGGAPTGASQVKIESNGMGRVASRWSHQPKQSPNPPVRWCSWRGRGVVGLVLRAPVDLFTLRRDSCGWGLRYRETRSFRTREDATM